MRGSWMQAQALDRQPCAAGGKSDPGDAYILADVFRTDGHRFRPLRSVSDQVKALRAMVRTRDELVAQRVAVANQLRALLEGFWPGAVVIFCDIDSPIALEFLDRYPTPSSARRLGVKRRSLSWPATPIRVIAHPSNCWSAFVLHPPAWPVTRNSKLRAIWSRLSSPSCARSCTRSSA